MSIPASISKSIQKTKVFSIVLMFGCLSFLTSLNYFLYPSSKPESSVVFGKSTRSDIPPSGPTEEKCSSGFSILEEFLHDPHPVISFGIARQVHLHGIGEAGQVIAFDGELLSPPPEC